MTYEEFVEKLGVPIENCPNLNQTNLNQVFVMLARTIRFVYDQSLEIENLKKINTELENRHVKLEDYIVEKLHKVK